jgi:hypothetical protein
MKRIAILMLAVGSLLSVEPAAAGLVWTARATLLVVARPGVNEVEFVKSRSLHRVTVSDMGPYSEFQLRIRTGKIEFNAVTEGSCSTRWQTVTEVTTVSCTKVVFQEPCEAGIWEATTLAEALVVSFFKKKTIAHADPAFVSCGCD